MIDNADAANALLFFLGLVVGESLSLVVSTGEPARVLRLTRSAIRIGFLRLRARRLRRQAARARWYLADGIDRHADRTNRQAARLRSALRRPRRRRADRFERQAARTLATLREIGERTS